MSDTLTHLTMLLNGSPVYYSSGMKQTTLDVLARLVEGGEVIEHRKGSSRWWSIEHQTLVLMRERMNKNADHHHTPGE